MSTVTDNAQLNRFEMAVPGGVAFVNYRRTPGVVALLYAKVPEALQGRGVGAELVRGTLELVRAQGDKVVPRCGFVATYMRRHKEVQDLLA